MSYETLFPHSFPKFLLASHCGFFGKSAAAVLTPQLWWAKPWKLSAAGAVSKLTVALMESVQTAAPYGTGSYRRLANGGQPTRLISEINSNFLKTTLWNGCARSWNWVWQNKTAFKAYLKPMEFLWALESSHHASLPKFLLQTLHSVSASPSGGTRAFCHQGVGNAETHQFASYVSC